MKKRKRKNHTPDLHNINKQAAQYDRYARHILADKQILSWIIKGSVHEVAELEPSLIQTMIEGEPLIRQIPVDPGQTNRPPRIRGLANDIVFPYERSGQFDLITYLMVPSETDIGKSNRNISRIIIHIEAQKNWPSEYDLIHRAIYYISRLISAKLLMILFSGQLTAEEQLYALQSEFGIIFSDAISKEMELMSSLGYGLLEEGYQQGIIKGRREGRRDGDQRTCLLVNRMIRDHREDELLRVTEDQAYRKQLLLEYGITDKL